MKWSHFFLLFFLIPSLIYARLHEKDCKNIRNQASSEDNRCSEFIEQYKKLGPNEGEMRIHILNSAIGCCQRAIGHYDSILNDIAQQSKKHRHESWCVKMKEDCKNSKKELSPLLNELQNELNKALSATAFEKANNLYKESEKKATLANAKNQDCPPRCLNNVDAVVSALNEVAHLYEEAASHALEALSVLIAAPFPNEENKAFLKHAIEIYQEAACKYKKEAADWPALILAQKASLKDRLAALKEDRRLFEEKGLKRSSYEVQKQILPILEQFIESSLSDEGDIFKEELSHIKHSIAAFEADVNKSLLTEGVTTLSPEEFTAREKERRELFFKGDTLLNPTLFLQSILQSESYPAAIPLDGYIGKNEKNFTLFTEQFYRFLVHSDTLVSELLVKVYEKGEVIYEETIALPIKNTLAWDRYIREDGLIFLPETKLKDQFGLNLRLQMVFNPRYPFSLIISQKGDYAGYQFSISLDKGETIYECNLADPPPWQLGVLRKPSLPSVDRAIGKSLTQKLAPSLLDDKLLITSDSASFPILDQLVEELKGDPLALTGYVYNEIAFADPFLYQEDGVFQAPGIHRNACMTYLAKQGSPWEQCQLLVYLLRKAGYKAIYSAENLISLPKTFVEKMLFTQLPEDQKEGLLKYPFVLFFDGKDWISLFPWMKEMQIEEGYDLYNLMPEEYASADRWILRYLKGDERILKHIGPDGDDTAGVLFARFIEEELRKQGLSLTDIGIHRTQLKKQFSSWEDFPRPSIKGNSEFFASLDKKSRRFAYAIVEVFSRQNPQKKFSQVLYLADLNCSMIPLRFSNNEGTNCQLHILPMGEENELYLNLDETDHLIDIKVSYSVPIGADGMHAIKTLSITKGTSAAICFHFGDASPKITSQFYEFFTKEQEEKKRLHALLAFVGAAYFEKCSRAEQILAKLHKVNPTSIFAFGLSKLSPDLSKALLNGEEDSKLPQIDMFWFSSLLSQNSNSSLSQQEVSKNYRQFNILATVDFSSNEHQVLREVFKDAISTVKLLQIAHLEQEKRGLPGEGFLVFTAPSFEAAEKMPEAAINLYFSHLKDLNLRNVKAASPGQWDILQSLLNIKEPQSDWAYAYMTPGLTSSRDGTYKEMGTLILHPSIQLGLISNNQLLLNGGLGSPLQNRFLTSEAIKNWQLIPIHNSYKLQVSPSETPTPPVSLETSKWSSDVRQEYKSRWSTVADPVDIVTGAFYIDEVDLSLPGPFPLEIRRNYNSQNPLLGDFGYGWKLGLNPFLIKQDHKLYAAEADGTIITYSFDRETSRWIVLPEENPELCNFNQRGIGGTANPFHAYIENDILHGSDGSKRYFEEGLLKKWDDTKGNTLTFLYAEGRLSRIESSNGDFCGLHYNHEGKISEIYAKDGRRISYDYNSRGDLVKVTLPNTATISYEYDESHRIFRETRPHGKVLENHYEEGRVTKQCSPMGQEQKMIPTAIFDYQDGVTTVTDAGGGKTTYKIFQKQIYKITDPLGHQTLQSWFIDEHSWFDPETEQIVEWDQPGGALRSLKSSMDKRGLSTYYLYDSQGNPEEIGLKGEDLTGRGESLVTKKLTYNAQNLCIQEEVLGQKTITIYDANFPYLPKRIEKICGNALFSYVEFEYNAFGQIEKEDHSGAVILWAYNTRGVPIQRTQITGTDDPDAVSLYSYNNQGQCIRAVAADSVQENDFDIMGNLIKSESFSPSGTLLSATYIGYNLNNQPIWKQTANSNNTLHLDYHATGLLNASRQMLSPEYAIAYTVYEYDSRGNLIEEVDPLGYCTYRDYDLLGRVERETLEGHSTHFTYEPGGLIETTTTPSGAKTTRLYTTNGLAKEENYPDGTKNSVIYDFFGRPIQETKKGIVWEIKYDDANHRIIRTHLETQDTEIQEFDARGNLISFTDAAGYTSEKTYDGLGRLKTEITPCGEQTSWNYLGDTVICMRPNGERAVDRYEGGHIVDSKVFDAHGALIAHSTSHYDPETDIQETVQGNEITVTWMNTLGLPIKVQKGDITTSYKYDSCGNCIASIDGEGRTTIQEFDGLRRMIQKELPDGSLLEYGYDLDSNLSECSLPNGVTWKASYDFMGRKSNEELQAGIYSSQRWEYTYENGYLKETKDPMQRVHTYLYDPYGRLAHDNVDGWERSYTYDPRGLLSSAEQIGADSTSWMSSWFYASNKEHSKIERSYNPAGRLISESVFLNDHLLQQTQQTWGPSSRSLQIGSHERDFVYQNKQLVRVSTRNADMSYAYDLGRALKCKITPFTTATLSYNASGLPENVNTRLPDGSKQELLEWNPSGKLSVYSTPGKQKRFSYNSRGYLQSAGEEEYEFDFGGLGTGVRTAAPNWSIPQDGLDAFGKITTEISDKISLSTSYNLMGQVITHNQRQFEWDPWGRLLKVTDATFTWEASYDALGRRLQTHYTPASSATLTVTSLYDPEVEFQEIGVKYGDKTFWKIYGPNSCDAIFDETGATVSLMHNALGQLAGVVSQQGILYSEGFPSSYGPQAGPLPIPSDLISYAQSLTWHGQSQDPTGLIWMGERYYEPKGGRFLSPDPIGYPLCLDPYAYANCDPINYIDLDGRLASLVYQPEKPIVIAGLNRLSSVCANIGLTSSGPYQVGSLDLPNGGIGFINGINNNRDESMRHSLRLSQYGQGVKVHGIYNATHSIPVDVLECIAGHERIHMPPVQFLKDQWNQFISTHDPEAKFLQICYSGGAIHVKNTLLSVPHSVQQRIIVLAISPGAIIPNELCFQSHNYVSKRDIVPHLDIFGKLKYGNQLQVLTPHPDAKFFDHEFSSPTFADLINEHMTDYIRDYGGIK